MHKVVFVVDRKDLDYQTTKEFNSFCSGSVDGTTNTRTLVSQLAGDQKLIVTTIQKLNTAIIKEHYTKGIEHLRNERVVFIFDEYHRSQFGKRTTKMLFGDVLHRYVITDAIRDENVLKFSVEYIRTFKRKVCIVDYIIANHDKKTHNKKYTAIFCVSGVPQLIEYYRLFKERREAGVHDLKVATIFSYQANEEDKDAVGFIDEIDDDEVSSEPTYNTQHSRDALEEFDRFMKKERVYKFYMLCEEEQLDDKMTKTLIKDCIYTDKEPLRDDIVKVMHYRPALKNCKSVTERIATRITDFVETFVDGV